MNELKLNTDCVRDILLSVEEECDFSHHMDYDRDLNNNIRLKQYTHEEIIYHIRQCEYSELIFKPNYYDGGKHIIISDLTPSGHQFLANIRDDNVWNGVKVVAKKVGSTSLNAITQIASNVITQIIKSQFNLV